MTEIVKETLLTDIALKEELVIQFNKIERRQLMIARKQGWLALFIGVVTIAFFLAGVCYFSKTRQIFFDDIQKEKELLILQRDSLRYDKEMRYRLLDTNEHFVMPIRDTIKINGDTIIN